MNKPEHENHVKGCACHEDSSGKCGCCEEEEEESKLSKILLAAAAALALVSLIPMNSIVKIVFAVAAVLLSAYPIAVSAVKTVIRRSFNETVLMLIAIVAACCLGEFTEAAAVAILYRLGEIIEDKAVDRSRRSIDAVADIQQDFANIIKPDGSLEKIDAAEVPVGAEIMVLPYERFPLDGVVMAGNSTADASATTGESMPLSIGEGVEVKSGMVNGKGSVTVRTTAVLKDSTASRIIEMVEEAAEKKGKTQRFITRVAKIYTIVVVALAALIAVIPSLITHDPSTWIYRALIFLVASCPCALVISVPLGFYTGLGAAAKNGIIVKGSVFVEAFAKAKAFVFDKTGTLTTGKFVIKRITPCDGFTQEEVLIAAAAAEHFSSHPIAKSIVDTAPEINESALSDFMEIAGKGTSVCINGIRAVCGRKDLLAQFGIDVSALPEDDVYVALNGRAVGSMSVRSEIRPEAVSTISQLRAQGIKRIVMLTGDNETAAHETAEECGIEEYRSGLLPGEKLDLLEIIKAETGGAVYVGDGINDAPVLAAADAGVAMGLGSRAASEAADVILTNDGIDRLAPAHKLFKRTFAVVLFNIVFSIAVKLLVLILGIAGAAPMWMAVFADVGVCLICVVMSSLIGAGKDRFFRKGEH